MSAEAHSRRDEDVQRAYRLQIEGGLQLGARTAAVGLGLAIIAHYTWPAFRRQTLPFKAYLVTGFFLSGLVFGAEGALLDYETRRRAEENDIRRQARLDLSRRGIIPTETEISHWRTAREKEAATKT